jgi:hypothetical protein
MLKCPFTKKVFTTNPNTGANAYLDMARHWILTPDPKIIPQRVRIAALSLFDTLALADSGRTMYEMGGFVELVEGVPIRNPDAKGILTAGDESE